jgi:GH24 family phage-related lysozyme (muramidase)
MRWSRWLKTQPKALNDQKSGLRLALNRGDIDAAPDEIRRYVKVHDRQGRAVVKPGLKTRRGQEVDIYKNGRYATDKEN